MSWTAEECEVLVELGLQIEQLDIVRSMWETLSVSVFLHSVWPFLKTAEAPEFDIFLFELSIVYQPLQWYVELLICSVAGRPSSRLDSIIRNTLRKRRLSYDFIVDHGFSPESNPQSKEWDDTSFTNLPVRGRVWILKMICEDNDQLATYQPVESRQPEALYTTEGKLIYFPCFLPYLRMYRVGHNKGSLSLAASGRPQLQEIASRYKTSRSKAMPAIRSLLCSLPESSPELKILNELKTHRIGDTIGNLGGARQQEETNSAECTATVKSGDEQANGEPLEKVNSPMEQNLLVDFEDEDDDEKDPNDKSKQRPKWVDPRSNDLAILNAINAYVTESFLAGLKNLC